MAGIDWTTIYKRYRGKWVGLLDDELTVVASGSTPQEVLDKSKKKGVPHPILAKMPSNLLPRVGGFRAVRLQNST